MGKLFNRFDFVALVCYTGYQDRYEALLPELRRVGLDNKVYVHWDFPSVFRDILYANTKKTPFCSKGGCFYMMVSHYNVIKMAYELNKKSILVMEDDIRFLKNLRLLETMLDAIPIDYDMLLLDRSKSGDIDLHTYAESIARKENEYWRKLDYGSSTGCYALSRKGMKHYLDIIETIVSENRNLANPDAYFQAQRWGETFWDSSYKRYFAYPSLASQCIIGRGGSHCSINSYWEINEAIGIHQKEYNIAMPIITKSNFLTYLYDYVVTNARHQKEIENVLAPNNTRLVDSTLGPIHCDTSPTATKYQQCYIWGNSSTDGNIESLQTAIRDGAEVILTEDGFIRSYDTWCGNSNKKYRQGHSVCFDANAYYFDATRVSTIEKMLNSPDVVVSDTQKEEARQLIRKIVENKISKYNHQPIECPVIGRIGIRKVLVVDQSYGDFSIRRGLADDSTFEKMLNAAIEENPDADILVKTHPDTLAGKKAEKKGYYQELKEHDNIYKVTFPINPYSLMEICDKVYVCSSQFGLEALMAGKEVHVFGMPFYAGWGLTIDAQHLDRRTNTRTIEELFYIFYCMYTHWVDPDKGCETTIDAVIDKMIALREEANSKKRSGVLLTDPSIRENGYRIGPKPKVYYGHKQQSNLNPRPKGWNW